MGWKKRGELGQVKLPNERISVIKRICFTNPIRRTPQLIPCLPAKTLFHYVQVNCLRFFTIWRVRMTILSMGTPNITKQIYVVLVPPSFNRLI